MMVDSSVWIHLLRGVPSPEADLLRQAIRDSHPIEVTGMILTEVLQGVRNDDEAATVASTMQAFPVVSDLDADDYRRAAAIFRACRARGVNLRSSIDCVIAQACLRHDLELLTRDHDFESIAGVVPLRLVRAEGH